MFSWVIIATIICTRKLSSTTFIIHIHILQPILKSNILQPVHHGKIILIFSYLEEKVFAGNYLQCRIWFAYQKLQTRCDRHYVGSTSIHSQFEQTLCSLCFSCNLNGNPAGWDQRLIRNIPVKTLIL